jgi:hypothetical protein
MPEEGHRMIRLTAVKRPVLGTAGALAIAAAGLLAVPLASASAAPSSPGTMSYACVLTSYGDSTPLTITAHLTAPTTAPVNSSVTVSLSTEQFTLPSAVPALSKIGLSATSEAGTGSPATLQFTGQAAGGTGPTIPAITATASLTLNTVGTTSVVTPAEIVLTPVDATGNALTAIDCLPPSLLDVTIAATGPAPSPTPTATPPPASGPVYTCTVAGSGTQDFTFPMRATATGPGQVGTTDQVTLSIQSPTVAANMRAQAKAQAAPTINLKASLPVTGVQTGRITVFGGNSVNASTIKATGKLALTRAGTDKILVPPAFQVIGVAPGLTVTLVSCTLKTQPDAVVLTLKVAGSAAHPGPEATGATPIGAPNTGGGGSLKSAFSVPQAAGGAGVLLAGAALTLGAIRRRKQGPRTAA